ncbi:hypothetical protein RJZ56_000500 [Blastomyces dermatitidis]|uniref:Chromosome segregation protein BIR1 n=1 Tax=Blastomyces gilchristii (strain SLH14081) TaxID=559298 RepID=A0A179UFS9_BLAGS|nr:chromosome segregation protein BIR1 [Blastomyces gilchristii SLH14081]XP_031577480.1 chromosome segregation protein BIR1, variant [Blastomyces gilchristii SLH14081]EQL34378.1 hypothetical protein BDFG_03735 [Blastomyces dermatitidis ATCC 26199]EQL34379.1 hypothetical protein, variant [Blastomyces dermatitidis ATCC 26199]OAT06895.1 chromosome segregation protein BIR1 [Blastomyces gilchristii SLH14081]OAT06896.1 chromosome segregation protein BIR1, variant [Blastomyces gilchristii SLH14081]
MIAIGMETVAARLATFYSSAPKGKRTSNTKATTHISWPHDRPSPEELAHAGFYFKPTPLSPDNAACFLCERALDGWEEDDDPVTEHLRHSSECGWAIMMDIVRRSSNPAEIEDPTNARIAEARRATFASMWPHDGKRGWVCKTEKMVEAGWYYCAHEESEDFVSCAYCNLSLDGWEPKDDPFEEHYRRSSDCSFFHFALNNPAKPTRGKKTRSSKASRLSTQSVATTVSEAPEADFDDEMDHSTLSNSTNRTSKTTRKTTKSKGKKAKSKKGDPVEVSSQVDIESNNGDVPETSRPKRTTRGRKRNSEAMNGDDVQNEKGDVVGSAPPAKRRAARSENTAANRAAELALADDQPVHVEEQPPRKPQKSKRASSTTRKQSTASKASLRSRIPDDDEIDAQLEADLAADIEADARAVSEQYQAHELPARTRYVSTVSVANAQPPAPTVISTSDLEEEPNTHTQKAQRKRNVGKKKLASKKSSSVHSEQEPAKVAIDEAESVKPNPGAEIIDGGVDEKMGNNLEMKDAVIPKGQEDEPLGNSQPKPPRRKPGRPKGSTGNSKKSKQQPPNEIGVPEEAAPTPSDLHTSPIQNKIRTAAHSKELKMTSTSSSDKETKVDPEIQKSTNLPRKVAFRASGNIDTSSKWNGARQRLNSPGMFERASDRIVQASHNPISPNARVHESTPSPSPQSSDAENRPPSSRPSNTRPTSSSASKPHTAFVVPLATSTPATSPSKIHAHSGQLMTSHPWSPVDPEEIFLPDSMSKENVNINDILHAVKGDLTSLEKNMTVEEWIMWNAKNGETKLRSECERLVGIFEREGGKAMMALEGIECTE